MKSSMQTDDFRIRQIAPEGRCYVHSRCQQETWIKDDLNPGVSEDGLDSQPHTALANPNCSWLVETYCCGCENVFGLDEFRWSDTGEKLTDYHRRWRREAKRRAGFIGTLVGAVLVLVLMSVVGYSIGLALGCQMLFNLGLATILGLIGFYLRSVWVRKRFLKSIGIKDIRQLI